MAPGKQLQAETATKTENGCGEKMAAVKHGYGKKTAKPNLAWLRENSYRWKGLQGENACSGKRLWQENG